MKRFRDPVAPREQLSLLPLSVGDFVARDAPVRVLNEIVDQLDCTTLYSRYAGGGAPAYDPRMMLKVLLFGYGQGLRSSRKLAQALEHDLRFMFLSEMSRPDFHTLCRFRRDNEAAIVYLFAQTVRLASEMGLVLLRHAAVDGTKIEANVARRRVVSGEQIEQRLVATEARIDSIERQTDSIEKQIEQHVLAILQEAEATDAAEDRDHGSSRGDGLADGLGDGMDGISDELAKQLREELSDAQTRKKRLQEAKERLAQEGSKFLATTDPESRLMKTSTGLRAAYNAQAVVDGENQIIIAAEVTQQEADNAQLPQMLEQTKSNCSQLPEQVSADTGYWSSAALEAANRLGVDAYIPSARKTSIQQSALDGWTYDAAADVFRSETGEELYFNRACEKEGRQYRVYRKCKGGRKGRKTGRKEVWVRTNGILAEAMRAKIATPEGSAIYRRRQQIVEPVFGHLKACLGLRRLLLRDLSGARIEYLLACSAHNLGKIVRLRPELAAT